MKELKIENEIYHDLDVSFIHSGLMRIEQDSNTNKKPVAILIAPEAASKLIEALRLFIDAQPK